MQAVICVCVFPDDTNLVVPDNFRIASTKKDGNLINLEHIYIPVHKYQGDVNGFVDGTGVIIGNVLNDNKEILSSQVSPVVKEDNW